LLFEYPVHATHANWLHDCLREMVLAVHSALDAGEDMTPWPDIIPIARRPQIEMRTGLRDRLIAYATAAAAMTVPERLRVQICLEQQNRIADLVRCTADCERLEDLPAAIRPPIADLFSFAFELLTPLGIRDLHYRAVYDATRYHVCPFCGCEYFDAPGAPREDLDHYLAKGRYPFAAVNLRNLVPMGMKCNERYKLAQDILRNDAGIRRRSFDPYAHGDIAVQLLTSVPFGGADNRLPLWRIEFEPNSPECLTWDEVFQVKERFERDVLNPLFFQWLGSFAEWFGRRINVAVPTDHEVLDAIQRYVEDVRLMKLSGRDFLRLPIFEMIHQQCIAGNQRLFALIRDLITFAVPA